MSESQSDIFGICEEKKAEAERNISSQQEDGAIFDTEHLTIESAIRGCEYFDPKHIAIPIEEIKKRLEYAQEVYRQQHEMLKNKTHRVGDRIVKVFINLT